MFKDQRPQGGKVLFHFSSIAVLEDNTIFTAPAGRNVWKANEAGGWDSCASGLPENAHINRLQRQSDRLFACTDEGLFRLKNEIWTPEKMPINCYQYKESGGLTFAATEHGLWCHTARGWKNTAFSGHAVYDFLYTPNFIYLAMDWGIAMYDRFTCSWEQFALGSRILSLGSFQGRLLGITENGELAAGNGRGGFERIRFEGMFIFKIVQAQGGVYLCTDRGLYRLGELRRQWMAVSVSLGSPVTDIAVKGALLYAATLNEGVQMIEIGREPGEN
ncbi:hypothetical protein [Cohnella thailandensis]|uniref:Uncharacterized protein n=1 Tax=Cohnella thailandensis TaxID=557557 RepID=A0A841T4A2_9BACL|nr:hypothetical protein [Cohnella thailandensis]MBB6638452.1 hypothetical protein [Cohnella thailandensis]MBP1977488.1 ligand-binding sensor domain-containing protein [Cohnella thailandensis]